jgi:hypothetical protein
MLPTYGASVPSLTRRCGLLHRGATTTGAIPSSRAYSIHGPLLSRRTGLLRQSSTTNTTATSDASRKQPSSGTGAAVFFYDTFTLSTTDVHLLLLEEAHRKHGVWLNVPPQLAPTVPGVGPPIIPDPYYPPKQQERLNALARGAAAARQVGANLRVAAQAGAVLQSEQCLAYPPTHQPPPFVTTGTRRLSVTREPAPREVGMVTGKEGGAPSSAAGAALDISVADGGGDASVVQLQTTVREEAVRAPVDATMLFHCSLCGRGFRRRAAADEHVERRHASVDTTTNTTSSAAVEAAEATATVLEGPGPGEIIGYRSVVAGAVGSPAAAATATKLVMASSEVAGTCHAVPGAPLPLRGLHDETGQSSGSRCSAAATPNVAATVTVPADNKDSATPSASVPLSSSSTSTSGRLVKSYAATPTVALPCDSLIDDILLSVWDDVALKRDDIVKAAGAQRTLHTSSGSAAAVAASSHNTVYAVAVDSCNGKYFIPSSAFVEGKADTRDELEADAAAKQSARATPVGAAPGVKRGSISGVSIPTWSVSGRTPHKLYTQRRNPDGSVTLVASGERGTGTLAGAMNASISAAPTAQEMSMAELARHYPNPFGDSPNAALLEQEKEPVNPFRDLEGGADAGDGVASRSSRLAATGSGQGGEGKEGGKASSTPAVQLDSVEGGEVQRNEWLRRFAARPYACPVCQQHALPGITAVLDVLWYEGPSSSTRDEKKTSSASLSNPPSTTSSPPAGRALNGRDGKTPRSAFKDATSAISPSPTDSNVVLDVEAWTWYDGAVQRFRLLDALEDHLETCHGDVSGAAHAVDELSDWEWQRLYQIASSPTRAAEAELMAVHRVYRATKVTAPRTSGGDTAAAFLQSGSKHDAEAPASATADVDAVASAGLTDSEIGGSTGSGNGVRNISHNGNEDQQGNERSAAGVVGMGEAFAGVTAPHVHVRSAVNTVLVGVVRDVQEGFVGDTRVIQYVLAIQNSSGSNTATGRTPAASNAAAADGGANERKEDTTAAADEELIVVRCVGDLVPATLLHQQVHLGSTLFVTGTLRMNRNVDTVSRRSHAYPYVQVVPPLGFVRVMG